MKSGYCPLRVRVDSRRPYVRAWFHRRPILRLTARLTVARIFTAVLYVDKVTGPTNNGGMDKTGVIGEWNEACLYRGLGYSMLAAVIRGTSFLFSRKASHAAQHPHIGSKQARAFCYCCCRSASRREVLASLGFPDKPGICGRYGGRGTQGIAGSCETGISLVGVGGALSLPRHVKMEVEREAMNAFLVHNYYGIVLRYSLRRKLHVTHAKQDRHWIDSRY